MTLQQFKEKLKEMKAAGPDVPVVIRGDSQTQCQAVLNLLSTTGSTGIGLAPTPAREPSH
jgi:biopolymer transport protein ExbD